MPFTAYDAAFERMQALGGAPEDALRLVFEDYLDGKPRLRGKKKISKAARDEAFWSSAVVCAVPPLRWQAYYPAESRSAYPASRWLRIASTNTVSISGT
jgi:hypothetical protein